MNRLFTYLHSSIFMTSVHRYSTTQMAGARNRLGSARKAHVVGLAGTVTSLVYLSNDQLEDSPSSSAFWKLSSKNSTSKTTPENEKTKSKASSSSSSVILELGVAMLPHPDKLYRGGEDAYFVSSYLNGFGVADGVGAWSSMGVNPGTYSRSLMKYCHQALREKTPTDTPITILRRAYDELSRDETRGSCTALIGYVNAETRQLQAANLGDSGFLVLRKDSTQTFQLYYRTKEQQHSFNCPFQLGFEENSDVPEKSNLIELQLQINDVLIAGTDGLLDNLFDSDILSIVNAKDAPDDPTELAYLLAMKAQHVALQAKGPRATPFAVHAAENGRRFDGGKIDDITVVVGKLTTPKPPRSHL